MDKVHKFAQIATIFFGVIAPCTLLAGYIYRLGFITAFGLDSELISRGLSEVITESWYVGLRLLVWLFYKLWWAPVFLVVMGVLLLVIGFILANLKPEQLEKLKTPITKENQGRKIFGLTPWLWKSWFESMAEIGQWVLMLLIVVVTAVALVIFPYKNGNDFALKQIAEIQKSNCETSVKNASSLHCIYLIDITAESKEPLVKGILVSANDSRVAISNGSKLEVWPLLQTYKLSKTLTRDLQQKNQDEIKEP